MRYSEAMTAVEQLVVGANTLEEHAIAEMLTNILSIAEIYITEKDRVECVLEEIADLIKANKNEDVLLDAYSAFEQAL